MPYDSDDKKINRPVYIPLKQAIIKSQRWKHTRWFLYLALFWAAIIWAISK
jgi:hypothetical protein